MSTTEADLSHIRETTLTFLKRSVNTLNDPNINTRRAGSTELYSFLQSKKHELDSILIEQIMNNFGKSILKAMSDDIEKVRENSAKTLNFLLSRCQDFSPHLQYIIMTMMERTNCDDLEGIQDLPEVMRPAPSQKPHVHTKLSEPVEEIRLEYCETISTIISCCNEDEIRGCINDIVNVLRSLSMDPCGEVQVKACQNISLLCRTFSTLLLHFSEILARAVLLPLVNKKSKVRIAGLEALGQILYCGVWKYNNNIMEMLIGFRDPNSVPISDFFEYSTKLNYFAMLIKDAKTNVREFFIRCLGDWLISLPDRFDHEPRLIPYMISGLFDPDDEISQAAYEIIDEVGLQNEREKEKEFRTIKQFGYDAEWTQGGKIKDIPLPKPIAKRPRIGARYFVRSHFRKFLPALYREVKDWQYENRLEAVNLLLYGLIYSEDYVVQFLDKFIINILNNMNIRTKEDHMIFDRTCLIFFYIGVYCGYKAFLPYIKSALKGEFSDSDDLPKFSLIALKHLIKGFFVTVIKEEGLKSRREFIFEVVDLLADEDFLPTVDKEIASIIEEIMEVILESLLDKGSADDLEEFYKEKRFKAQMISYAVLRYRLTDFENKVSKKDLNQDFRSDLNAAILENKLVKAFNSLEEIFEDLLMDSFIENLQKELSDSYLNILQWKVIYTYFMITISQRALQGSKNDENLLKILTVIKATDLSQYAKAAEVLQMNVLIIKVISDSFTDEELTKSNSSFLFNLVDLNRKLHYAAEKNSAKLPGLQEKLLLLSKHLFTRAINWVDAAQSLEGKTDPMKEFAGNTAELIWLLLENTIKPQENNTKEFKNRIVVFKDILSHIGSFILKKSRYFKTSTDKYLVPELISYLVHLHEKFVNNDEEDVLKILFESLFMILMVIPETKIDTYKGEPWVTLEYNQVLDRIIVLAIDAKDNDTREKYRAVLKSLSRKTPFNILELWEKAVKSQSISRMELMASLKKFIEA